jgi:hypothetical protein
MSDGPVRRGGGDFIREFVRIEVALACAEPTAASDTPTPIPTAASTSPVHFTDAAALDDPTLPERRPQIYF